MNTMTLAAIVAMDENRLIGANGTLPWHLPADLKHFKSITTGFPILMGRKTYESIGKPLPNRTNIVMSQDKNFKAEGCQVVSDLKSARLIAQQEHAKTLFVVGGSYIFSLLMPEIERIYLTTIHHAFVGDIYFPALDMSEWVEVAQEKHFADNNNPYDYTFSILERKRER